MTRSVELAARGWMVLGHVGEHAWMHAGCSAIALLLRIGLSTARQSSFHVPPTRATVASLSPCRYRAQQHHVGQRPPGPASRYWTSTERCRWWRDWAPCALMSAFRCNRRLDGTSTSTRPQVFRQRLLSTTWDRWCGDGRRRAKSVDCAKLRMNALTWSSADAGPPDGN